MPRATTAAWEVMPPRAVRIALASTMPWKSSGLVSRRTRITASPFLPSSSARSAVNTTAPDAAPGEAGRPVVRRSSSAFGSIVGWSSWSRSMGGMRATASSSRDQPLVHHLAGDPHRRVAGALGAPGLQHVELAALDGELEVLHVAEVPLQGAGHALQLGEGRGQRLPELVDRLRVAGAADHVLALRVEQVFAVQHPLAGGGIPSEGDAGARVLAQVAEDHRHDVDGGAHRVGNVVQPPVVDGALGVPALEDRLDGAPELVDRLVGEGLARWRR